jgi:hypothetical protein
MAVNDPALLDHRGRGLGLRRSGVEALVEQDALALAPPSLRPYQTMPNVRSTRGRPPKRGASGGRLSRHSRLGR